MPLIIISIMLISPIMGIPFLIYSICKVSRKIDTRYSIPFAILYGSLGYNLFPNDETDLTRYFQMLDSMRDKNIFEIISMDLNGLYTRDILFYFVVKTGDNHILPFLIGFFCYWIIFYIFFDTVNRMNILNRKNGKLHVILMGILITSITSPYILIGNVRCVFAYLLIFFAIYREYIEKKKNWLTLFIYIIPIGLHTTAIAVVLLRILVPYIRKISRVIIVLVLFLPTLVDFLYQFLISITISNQLWSMLVSCVRKVRYFLYWKEGGWADVLENSFLNKVTRVYGIFFLVCVIIIYFVIKKNKVIVNGDYEKYIEYVYTIAILALSCLWIKTGAFWRMETVAVVFSHVILFMILDIKKNNWRYLLYFIYFSGCVMFCLNAIHFWRNMETAKVLSGYITMSVVPVIIHIIQGIFNFI